MPVPPASVRHSFTADFKLATADGRITKQEVVKLIRPHADEFCAHPQYLDKLAALLQPSSRVKLSRAAKTEVNRMVQLGACQPKIPTDAEMAQVYGEAARNAVRQPIAAPPFDPATTLHWDITPAGIKDVAQTVYESQGNLYLKVDSARGPRTRWFDVGPAPLF